MKTLILTLTASLLITACTRNNSDSVCEKTVTIDETLYQTVNTTNYNIINAKINGDCLEIKFGASGCNGNTWVVQLVDSKGVIDLNPRTRLLKFSLTNNELCTAAFQRTISFDIKPLRVNGSKKIRLALEGFNQQIIYNY